MSQEQLFGVYCEGIKGKHIIYSFNEIKNVEFIDFVNGRSGILDAIFRVSSQEFAGAEDMGWNLSKKSVLYIDVVLVKPDFKATVIYDVVSDMMVECASTRNVKTLRVKVDTDSELGKRMQENGYISIGSNAKYEYFEIETEDYI